MQDTGDSVLNYKDIMTDNVYTHLYELSIDSLGLSIRSMRILKRTGIATIGDCLDVLNQGPQAMISYYYRLPKVMWGEVREKLIVQGYGQFIDPTNSN